ncbi:pilus assembly protein [Neptuniibacter sp. SY11_33]|uniref:pilus assembly protein n=1 Tax=Neptuniibacter sp. SY11_33 TaxID=3398215 RepID=UPI0039F5A61C
MKVLFSKHLNLKACSLLFCAISFSSISNATTVAQTPLFLGEGNVPGNLALVPSVEWPTVLSAANIGSYDEDTESIGYFDSGKCYSYQYESTETDRHFYPVSLTSNYKCPGDYWSGNYLNWATTQTIDPFRWALTGGYRVKDTVTETWVEKARHSGQNNYFDERTINGSSVVNNATPFSTSWFKSEVGGLSNQMHFTLPSGHGYTNITSPTSSVVFADTDFSSGWSAYSNGNVSRSSTVAQDDSFSLKKTDNDDPHGGYKDIGSTVDYDDFTFEAWIYRPTVGTQNGQSDRLSLSNGSASGYGFNVSQSNIKIERRNSGGASSISSTVSFTRPRDEWYRVVFESETGNKFKLTVYNSSGSQLATVTSNADSNYSNFSRLYIHGGHEYYVDNITINEISGGGTVAYENISSDKYGTSVRVKVCDSNIGVEENCKQYGSNWKPEGLIQRYSGEIRYSIFGYLNDSNFSRDGGVLRASKKFVGPTKLDPTLGEITNPNAEWDSSTGVLIQNPDSSDASDTATYYGVTVADSGVLNYLNKFGQLNSNNFKSYDPVSELYYTSLRYFKNQGNIEEYYTKTPSHNSSPGSAEIRKWVDGFPVVRTWSDPIQYACQKNVVLGIGDVNTHRDKNLPGNTSGTDEPSKPSEVSSDNTVDVRTATDKIAALEGISIDTGAASYSGRNNSAYMAGLAYDANTSDIRPNDFAGTQTVQTYWVDVLENEVLRDKRNNQFWLTAKYGGFVVRKHPSCEDPNYTPTGTECATQSLGDPYLRTDSLPEWWWYTNTDVLDPNSGSDYNRADNFYTAGEARKMIDGLTDAFTSIAASIRGAGATLTASSSRLDDNSAVYNALMDTTLWSGDLVAQAISGNAVLAGVNSWSAASIMDALAETDLPNRKIYTSTYAAEDILTGVTLNEGGVEFKWTSLSAEQKEMLRKTPSNGPLTTEAFAQQRLDFLRGSRTLEQTVSNTSNPFRQRGSRLGDIVNSSPKNVEKLNFGYGQLAYSSFPSDIDTDYVAYRATTAYVNKPNLILLGANDGMLHIFDASFTSNGGKELFAYVPSNAFGNLYELTDPDYSHRFYVDGPVDYADAWFDLADVPTGVSDGWKTVAVSTLGAGGKGVSLLDISDPENMDGDSVLWEFSHEDMGVLIQKASVVALPNGKFGVIVSSGFSHGKSQGHIWLLNVADGSIIKDFVVPSNGGLGQVLAVDKNGDKVTDRLLVGDTNGNLWRFDLSSTDPLDWEPPAGLLSGTTPVPFFTATDGSGTAQPITAPVEADFDSKGRIVVFFGTGSYYLIGDNEVGNSPQVQSLYGVHDTGAPISGRSDLLEQEIYYEATVSEGVVSLITDNEPLASDKGWFLDLEWSTTYGGPGPKGELVHTKPVIRIGSIIFASKIPSNDPCLAGGETRFYSLDPTTGGVLSYSSFDTNGDGVIDDSDKVAYTYTDENGDEQTIYVPASGIIFDGGGGSGVSDDSIVNTSNGDARILINDSDSDDIFVKNFNEKFSEGRQAWREVQ